MDHDWNAIVANIQKAGIRFLEIRHVDGRRFHGELGGISEGPSGHPQVVLNDNDGRQYRLYFSTIRNIRY
jgi:hypothetical protein